MTATALWNFPEIVVVDLIRSSYTRYHILSISRQRNKSSPVYYLETDLLSTVSSHTYLGITVSSDHKWHEHISNICLNATRTLNFVRHNTYCCSQEAKNLAYLSLIRPHLEYAAAVWDPYMAKDIQQLKRVQRRAARILKKDYRYTTSVTGLLDKLGWLPLFERRKHSRLMIFHKSLNNLSAFSLDHLSVSSRHTRASNENKFVSLPVRTDVFKYSFFSSDHYRLDHPPIGCSSLAVNSVLPRVSAELGILQPLLITMTLRGAGVKCEVRDCEVVKCEVRCEVSMRGAG